ncbi:hypothetical protein ANN_20496 [Periplaneta americana]|uniref:Uncharacterized protein n=1 Tax=Periplaneta americana TaxID=6978 RepID=A0ABQ8SD01_PERAM|nr:hypothetical protein ANN_20496 [Periplaneta americana]
MACSITRLKPLDVYLWGHLKDIVYGEPVPDVETLEQCVHVACDAIRTQTGTIERVRQSIMQCVNACIGWASGVHPDSKQGRLIFIRYCINAARCSAGKKGDEEKSYGSP